MILRVLSAVPLPRSVFARSLLLTLSLLALAAGGYQYQQYRQLQRERLARWQTARELAERLNRTVDLRFPEPPTLANWLAEWSRQSEVPIDFAPNVQADVADELVRLYLPPMSAREALQTLARVTDNFLWSPQPDGSIALGVALFPPEPVARSHPLPTSGIAAEQWAGALRCARPRWFAGTSSLIVTPAALNVVQYHSVQLQIDDWLQSLGAAEARARQLPPTYSNDGAWQPQLIGDDPARMQKALAVLRQRLDLQTSELPLDMFAWELSKRVNFPIVLDREFADDHPFLHSQTMVAVDCRQATLQTVVAELLTSMRVSGSHLRIVPVEGGRALAIRSATAAEKKRDHLTYLYPIADLLHSDQPLHTGELANMLVELTGNDDWHGSQLNSRIGGGRFGDSLIITHSQRVHEEIRELLAAIRQARAGWPPEERASPRAHPLQPLLDQPAELVYLDVSLADIAADIQRRCRLPVRINKAVEGAFLAPEVRIWCHLPQQPLVENLRRMLAPYNLTAIVKADHLLITVQEDALRPSDYSDFDFDIHNLHTLARGRQPQRLQAQQLVLDFGGDHAWKKNSGGQGTAALLGDLLILKHWPDALAVTRPLMRTVREHAFRSPADVAALAASNRSAPILRGERLRSNAPDYASSEIFERTLETRDTVSLSNVTVREALLHVVRKHQLPLVDPGSFYVDVSPEEKITLDVVDEPVWRILQRCLRPGTFKRWVLFGGTLQTWDRMTGAGVKERWLFDVADLIQPAGKLQPGQLLRTLDQKFHRPPQAYSDLNYTFYLDRWLGVHARQEELLEVQRTLHALRTGELPPLPAQADDGKQELPARFNPSTQPQPKLQPAVEDPFQ